MFWEENQFSVTPQVSKLETHFYTRAAILRFFFFLQQTILSLYLPRVVGNYITFRLSVIPKLFLSLCFYFINFYLLIFNWIGLYWISFASYITYHAKICCEYFIYQQKKISTTLLWLNTFMPKATAHLLITALYYLTD